MPVICVVKSDAYGHGMVNVAKTLESAGADFFAVANLSEALLLRDSGISSKILVLGYTDTSKIPVAADALVTQSLISYDYALSVQDALLKCGKQLDCHLKINTGMNRFGFSPDDKVSLLNVYKLKNVILSGIYTHFSCADEKDNPYTLLQYKRFTSVKNTLQANGIDTGLCHLSNTSATNNFPYIKGDALRCGIMLYGYGGEGTSLKNVMSFKTSVVHIFNALPGDRIGYGGEYIFTECGKVGVLPIGYNNGFIPHSNSFSVMVGGALCKVIGRVCMNHSMIDITGVDCKVGDEVTVFDSVFGINNLSAASLSSPYHTMCNIGSQNHKIYITSDI